MAALLDGDVARRRGVDLEAAERGDGPPGPAHVCAELLVGEGHVGEARTAREPVPRGAWRDAGAPAPAVGDDPHAKVAGDAEAGDGGTDRLHRDADRVALAARVPQRDRAVERAAGVAGRLA